MKNKTQVYADILRDKLEHHDPKQTAIVWEDATAQIQCISYQNLRKNALQQAINLQSLKPIRIGVWLPRTADYVTTFLSIWIAGAVYVPITDASVQRVSENLEFKIDFEKRVRALTPHLDAIIADAARIEILKTLTTVKLIDIQALSQGNSTSLQLTQRTLQSEAFIYCSSGTTGTPKIIALPYEGIEDRVLSVTQELGITEQDSILNYTGFDFDPSLMEMIQAILFGCPLIMAPEYARCDPRAMGVFYEKLAAQGIAKPTIAIIVPSMLKVMDPRIFGDLKALMTTGENILPKDLEPWFKIENLRIFTGYGPTEMTWGATLTEISRDPICIHVSKPMRGIEIFLVPSEGMHKILIGGNGQGTYLGENAEANTQKNWLQHEGQRCFNPHDGVLVEDGKYIYCGRHDDVIKYHGKWINLEMLDAIAERYPSVEFATTVSIPGSSLIFVFLVLRKNATLSIRDLESHFRSEIGCELFPTFFHIKDLKCNDRGKRCRKLTDYADSRPLSIPKSTTDPLALIWMQALTEADLPQIQAAFSAVGVPDYEQYLPDYGVEDRFDEWGGRSLKLTRLVALLWDEYIKDPDRSQQTFKHGILRHQSFGEMSLFLRLYQTVRGAFSHEQFQFANIYSCLWIKIQWDFPDTCLDECCEILESEIKAYYSAPFYHLILNCDSGNLRMKLESYFTGQAIVDDCLRISSSREIEKSYLQHLIKTRLSQTPAWDNSIIHTLVPDDYEFQQPITLLGTACGKTSFLKNRHATLKRAGKVVYYISCRQLTDEANNLQTHLGFTQEIWGELCEGNEMLSEIYWLIDDVEVGFHNNRLYHLQQSLKCLKGKNFIIYSGRENLYPFLKDQSEYGDIQILPSNTSVDIHLWFHSECNRLGQSTSEFYSQLKFLVEQFIKNKYIQAENRKVWWDIATPELIQSRLDQPPLYLSQYPCFSSLVRFLTLHDARVYSLRNEYQSQLQEYFSTYLSYTTKPRAFLSVDHNSTTQVLPSYIRYYPGDPWLSPWIFFHSISGECPDGYEACAEMISKQTRQATYTISLPELQAWESLEDQVSTYLEAIERSNLVPEKAPFYLLGWSYGGYLALEAARQLEQQGRSVAIVVNLDAAPLFSQADFQWEEHLQYVRRFIPPEQLTNTQGNLARLRKYSQSTERLKIKTKHTIFEATVRPKLMRKIEFESWSLQTTSLERFPCECDHFSLFSNLTFRSQFQKIISSCSEQSDPRSLQQRLDANAKAYLQEQDKFTVTTFQYIPTPLDQRIYSEFIDKNDTPRYLIIEGPPGAGKSRFVSHLALELMRINIWKPIVLQLGQYSGIRDFDAVLARYGFSPSDVRQLKTSPMHFLFILDGFDEGDLDLNEFPISILNNCSNIKLIITTRSSKLATSQFIDRRCIWTLPALEGSFLDAWYSQLESRGFQNVRDLLTPGFSLRVFDQITPPFAPSHNVSTPDLNWIKTPLGLSMLLTLHNSGADIESLIFNPFKFYLMLEEVLFRENTTLIKSKSRHYSYTYTLALFHWLGHDVSQHTLWNHADIITQSFKKATQVQEENGKLTFSHLNWRDFHLCNLLLYSVSSFKSPEANPRIPLLLSCFKLIDLPKNEFIIRLLISYWNNQNGYMQHHLRKKLFTIVLFSRRHKKHGPSMQAATTAMELLHIFNISLSGLELSEIEIPNCNLFGAILTRTRLLRANLSGATLTNANLEGANFEGACLQNIDCGATPVPISSEFQDSHDDQVKPSLQQFFEKNRNPEFKKLPLSAKLLLFLSYDPFEFYPHSRILIREPKSGCDFSRVEVRQDEQQSASISRYAQDPKVLLSDFDGTSTTLTFDEETSISHMVYSPPHGKRLAIVTTEGIFIYHSRTKALIGTISGHGDPVCDIAFHPKGKIFAVRKVYSLTLYSFRENTIVIHHTVAIKKKIYSPPNRTPMIFMCLGTICYNALKGHLLYHPMKHQIVTSDESEIITLWRNAEHKFEVHKLSHDSKVVHMSYRPNCDELISVTEGNQVYFWDMSSFNIFMLHPLPGTFKALSYSPTGKYLAVGLQDSIQLWDAETRRCLHEIPAEPKANLEWLPSLANANREPTYFLSFVEKDGFKCYEITEKEGPEFEVTLIWASARSNMLIGNEVLLQPQSAPLQTVVPQAAATNTAYRSHLPLDILLKISDYLCYEDYFHFILAYEIPETILQQRHFRPLLKPSIFNRHAATVGEQLQRMGFFATNRPVAIHNLELNWVEPVLSWGDSYQSLSISEKDGGDCGEVDIYLLNDLIRLAGMKK